MICLKKKYIYIYIKRWKIWGEKLDIFTVPRGKINYFGKKVKGQKYHILGKYTPLSNIKC